MNFDSDSQQQPSQQTRRWIEEQLQLEELSGPDLASLKIAALPSFFESLEEANYAISEAKIEAVELAFGRPAESTRHYLQNIECGQLEQIDAIISGVAAQLKDQASDIDLENLEKQLNGFSTQTRFPRVSHYANQVLETAKLVDFSSVAPKPLSKQIAAALFHISAVRPSQRLEIQNQYVEQISPLGMDVCGDAVSGIDTRKLNLPFHLYQFFLEELICEEIEISDFIISSPVSASSVSLHPYKHDFGTLPSRLNGSGAPAKSPAELVAIALVATFILIPILLYLPTNTAPLRERNRHIKSTINAKHPVIIFDKHDPNKYAVKMVKMGQEIGRPLRLEVSPEHPGPFVNVPLSEIDPVEVTPEDIENDMHYKVLKILSGVKKKSKGQTDD